MTKNNTNRKIFIYGSFVLASAVVVAAFITAKNYTQLIGASLLYPPLIYFAFKLFPRKDLVRPKKLIAAVKPTSKPSEKDVGVVDFDRRAFLKLIGATGISFFLFSLLGRRAETLLFGQAQEPATTSPTQPLPTDDYKISEIDDTDITFYGFVNKTGAWFIMKEDPDSGTFRYARGDSGFPRHWANRKQLIYDYFHELF